jgi:hypothetical protein
MQGSCKVNEFGTARDGKSPGASRIKSAVNLRKTDGSVSNKWLLQCSKVSILIFNGILTGVFVEDHFFWRTLVASGDARIRCALPL